MSVYELRCLAVEMYNNGEDLSEIAAYILQRESASPFCRGMGVEESENEMYCDVCGVPVIIGEDGYIIDESQDELVIDEPTMTKLKASGVEVIGVECFGGFGIVEIPEWKRKLSAIAELVAANSGQLVVINWFEPKHVEELIGREITEDEYQKIVNEWGNDGAVDDVAETFNVWVRDVVKRMDGEKQNEKKEE